MSAVSMSDDQGGKAWTIHFNTEEGNLPEMVCGVDTTFAAVVALPLMEPAVAAKVSGFGDS